MAVTRNRAQMPVKGGDSVTALKGVGAKVAARLTRIDVQQVQDLWFHLPNRYQDRTRLRSLGSLRPYENVVAEGTIDLCETRFGRRRSLLCRISDGTGSATLRLFHYSATQAARMQRGERIRIFGEVRPGQSTLEFIHPEIQYLDAEESPPLESCLTPVYPTTDGVHQLTLRKLMMQALASLTAEGVEDASVLPEVLLASHGLPSLIDALNYLHHPPADAVLAELESGRHPVCQRLIFEELLAHQVSMRRTRQHVQQKRAPVIESITTGLAQQLLEQLPFTPTSAQSRVSDEISADLAQAYPMLRLLQGDVGCGKTLVAALAALHCIDSGYQVVVMAPTEMLAEQHLRSLGDWLFPLGVEVGFLSGRIKGNARSETLQRIAQGDLRMVVGTHALFQSEVIYERLGLVVIDEQHRFGVHQRLALIEKGDRDGIQPHQLVMTATPIPRTLAMTAYADLDVSVIDELPPGRTPVETAIIPETRRADIVQRVEAACREGRQVYWVCPLIDESDVLQCQAAEESVVLLREALPQLSVGLVHGRMTAAERDPVMASFKNGSLQLLVATTVIEVGVDVPNASLMIIENAERLGLSQLHQLRGRVGRGEAKSHCVLLYKAPLSQVAQQRLATMRDTNDGFEVSRKDLELRGPGEVLGTRQSGIQSMRIADVLRDQHLIDAVRSTADEMLQTYPQCVDGLVSRWLPGADGYGSV